MGKFSDDLRRRRAANRRNVTNEVEFSCTNCLNLFNFNYRDIYLKSSGDIEFQPEPSCPRCGSTVDLTFTDYSQEQIEDMLLKGEIRNEN